MSLKKEYTALIVLPSKESYAAYKELEGSVKQYILQNDGHQWFKTKVTNFQEFLSGGRKDSFDFVALVFPEIISLNDIDFLKEMYLYYSEVPVCQYFLSFKMKNQTQEVKKVTSYFQQNFNGRVIKEIPYFIGLDNIENFYAGLKKCIKTFDQKYDNDLKIAFNKFDTDGSGAIDKQELADLSKELGCELSEEQLQDALKDLDLNGDGVIDLDEFSRWYFGGMRPYGGFQRTLLSLGKETYSILQSLQNNDSIATKKLNTHKFYFALNFPVEATVADVSLYIVGPQYEKIFAESNVFKSESEDYKQKDAIAVQETQNPLIEEDRAQIFLKLSISLEPGNLEKNQKFFEPLEQQIKEFLLKTGDHFFPKFEITDSNLNITILGFVDKKYLPPQMTQNNVDALKEVEQFINLHMILGFDFEQINSARGKSLLEHLLKGFSVQLDLNLFKEFKNNLVEILKRSSLSFIFRIFNLAPDMICGSNANIRLEIDDVEELKNDGHFSQFGYDFQTFIQNITPHDIDYYENWKEQIDLASIDQAKLREFEEKKPQQKNIYENLSLKVDEFNFMDTFSQNTTLEASVLVENIGLAEFKLKGAGLGKLISLIYKIGHLQEVKQKYEYLKKKI